ncbi:hypothetical protein HPG69_006730 [Diceros bicornis minor]|uniref:Uncharacterized protein n=1 Tax=Diceros bicornis minor TaxID=77932 RepID=A0A7J7F6A8_DICBM|nr:hypothetical protein HPG69_006730 [Diceros bicornis minor]
MEGEIGPTCGESNNSPKTGDPEMPWNAEVFCTELRTCRSRHYLEAHVLMLDLHLQGFAPSGDLTLSCRVHLSLSSDLYLSMLEVHYDDDTSYNDKSKATEENSFRKMVEEKLTHKMEPNKESQEIQMASQLELFQALKVVNPRDKN